jgi:hypothetical protein
MRKEIEVNQLTLDCNLKNTQTTACVIESNPRFFKESRMILAEENIEVSKIGFNIFGYFAVIENKRISIDGDARVLIN